MDNLEFFRRSLAELETTWRQEGWPIADHLAPGASEEHLRQIEAALEYAIPPELNEWWSWHDGVIRLQPGTRLGRESQIGAGGWEFLSSAEALAERNDRYDAFPGEEDELEFQGGWQRSWLPLLTFDARCIFVDCRQATPAGTVPLRLYEHVPEDVFTPRFGCLLYGVLTWTYVLQQRYFFWEAAQGGPGNRFKEMPPVLRLLTG